MTTKGITELRKVMMRALASELPKMRVGSYNVPAGQFTVILQRGDDRARRYVVANVDKGDTHRAGEWRLNTLVVQARFCFCKLRFSSLQVCPGLVVLGLGDRLLCDQLAVAIK